MFIKLAELTKTAAFKPVKSLDSVFEVSPPDFSMTALSIFNDPALVTVTTEVSLDEVA